MSRKTSSNLEQMQQVLSEESKEALDFKTPASQIVDLLKTIKLSLSEEQLVQKIDYAIEKIG
jgi:RNA polymerase-binding transcription factor DksA